MMWFSNAIIYQWEWNETTTLSELLASEALKPCPPHARFIYGWLPVFEGLYALETAGCALIAMGKEERILPRGVVQRLLQERIQKIEAERGRPMRRAEKSQLAEELEFELLPKSFCVQKRLLGLLDYSSKRLIINTSSMTQATQFTALLRKSIPSIHLEPLSAPDNLALHFTNWINQPSQLPSHFQLAADCALFSLDDETKRFTCKGYELPAEEVLTLLSQGLAAAEISLIWNERVQLTLTHQLILKKIKCLDYLVDEFNEIHKNEEADQQAAASLTLLAGELNQLLSDLLTDLNNTGEVILKPEPNLGMASLA